MTSVLAVVAHPDDESFGLGGILRRLADAGATASVLCFTHGEASTLGGRDGDLDVIRPAEFEQATRVLGVGRAELLRYPDAGLSTVPTAELAAHVTRMAGRVRPSHLLAFDVGGITGHPDHQRATAAALAAASELGLPLLIWVLPQEVADALNSQFGTSFAGRPGAGLTRVRVNRARQWAAIACHASQSADNPVLRRRLELLGDSEHVLVIPALSGRPQWERLLVAVRSPGGKVVPAGAGLATLPPLSSRGQDAGDLGRHRHPHLPHS